MRPIEKYLDEVKKKAGIGTDKELAEKLGIKPAAICHIKSGVNTPSEDHCRKLAQIAGDSYEKVLLLAQISKASEQSKPFWEKIVKYAVKGGLAMGLAVLISSLLPSQDSTSTFLIASFIAPHTMDIMSNRMRGVKWIAQGVISKGEMPLSRPCLSIPSGVFSCEGS